MIILLNLKHIILELKILDRHLLTKLSNLIIYYCIIGIFVSGILFKMGC